MNQDTVPINKEPKLEKPIVPIENTTQLMDDNKKRIVSFTDTYPRIVSSLDFQFPILHIKNRCHCL